MARYDKQQTNAQIQERVRTLREQMDAIGDSLSFVETSLQTKEQDEPFSDSKLQQQLTDVTLSMKNLNVGTEVLWKLTRR